LHRIFPLPWVNRSWWFFDGFAVILMWLNSVTEDPVNDANVLPVQLLVERNRSLVGSA
jgi:hypothetical protein